MYWATVQLFILSEQYYYSYSFYPVSLGSFLSQVFSHIFQKGCCLNVVLPRLTAAEPWGRGLAWVQMGSWQILPYRRSDNCRLDNILAFRKQIFCYPVTAEEKISHVALIRSPGRDGSLKWTPQKSFGRVNLYIFSSKTTVILEHRVQPYCKC